MFLDFMTTAQDGVKVVSLTHRPPLPPGIHLVDVDVDCRTGSLHLGPCIRALCAPYWNSFLPSSPDALRTYRRERPLLAREGN
jgi:hypothetical protein